MTPEALDGGVEGPNLEALSRFDQIQDATCADKVGVERVDDLQPGNIGIWPLD